MDVVAVFVVGMVCGGFLAWAIIAIQRGFKSSRDLNAGVAKARKEIQDKAKKVREDKQKAQAAAIRSLLLSILLILSVLLVGWLVTIVIMSLLP